jgi:ADP-heptose:LPS heptosyltransferase
MPQKFLIIQTAFIGDVVLATGIIEKLHRHFPDAEIDFLLRKGNESLLTGHPFLHEVLVWDKKESKIVNLLKLLRYIRKRKYDKVINVQRFAATGFLTALSGAAEKIGFDKNPFSLFFHKRIKHHFAGGKNYLHEMERNNRLIRHFTGEEAAKPKLYPSASDVEFTDPFRKEPYISISPASVWFTKQFPWDKWMEFINKVPEHLTIYLLGSNADVALAEKIREAAGRSSVINLCGRLSFLQTAALMQHAVMNYSNDSASTHIASAMNAPVTTVYCSTLPSFGFGPLSDKSFIVETVEKLSCRPCGIHGRKTCPLGHFHCAYKINADQLLATMTVSE